VALFLKAGVRGKLREAQGPIDDFTGRESVGPSATGIRLRRHAYPIAAPRRGSAVFGCRPTLPRDPLR